MDRLRQLGRSRELFFKTAAYLSRDRKCGRDASMGDIAQCNDRGEHWSGMERAPGGLGPELGGDLACTWPWLVRKLWLGPVPAWLPGRPLLCRGMEAIPENQLAGQISSERRSGPAAPPGADGPLKYSNQPLDVDSRASSCDPDEDETICSRGRGCRVRHACTDHPSWTCEEAHEGGPSLGRSRGQRGDEHARATRTRRRTGEMEQGIGVDRRKQAGESKTSKIYITTRCKVGGNPPAPHPLRHWTTNIRPDLFPLRHI